MERNVRFQNFLFLKNINILVKDMFFKEEIIKNSLDLNNHLLMKKRICMIDFIRRRNQKKQNAKMLL